MAISLGEITGARFDTIEEAALHLAILNEDRQLAGFSQLGNLRIASNRATILTDDLETGQVMAIGRLREPAAPPPPPQDRPNTLLPGLLGAPLPKWQWALLAGLLAVAALALIASKSPAGRAIGRARTIRRAARA